MDRLTCIAMALALCSAFLAFAPARAAADYGFEEIQRDWEQIRYRSPAGERVKRYEALAAKAHRLTESQPGRSEPMIWEGIVVSSLAGEKRGLGALGLARRAKLLFENAIRIDGNALEGSAFNSLGALYHKAPGWPFGFGDQAKAKELLLKALAINPGGIDPNYFYAEYLVETGRPGEALAYLARALLAPARPGRQLADAGCKEEARALLEQARKSAP